MRKYELIESVRKGFYRIKAIINFADVEAGDIGGFVENESNLSHEGEAWVYDNAIVSSNARVFGDARVSGNAKVSGNARVSGNAHVYEHAFVSGNANVYSNAQVYDYAKVSGNANVYGNAQVYDHAHLYGNTNVYGNAHVYDYALVSGYTKVCANATISETYHIFTAGPVGSRKDDVTFFRNDDKEIFVVCGCFEGTITEFLNKVNETYPVDKDIDSYGDMYRSLVEIAENKSNILR